MRILVIPDVHIKPWMFSTADRIDPDKYDRIVCLGDIADDWQVTYDDYKGTMDDMLAFAGRHKDHILWCYGNHDISYLFSDYGIIFDESGFTFWAKSIVADSFRELKKFLGQNLGIIFRIDDVLFSHAGLTQSFADQYTADDTDVLLTEINSLVSPGKAAKLWHDVTPIWARPQNGAMKMYRPDMLQVVGHTPVKRPMLKDGVLTLDTFSTYPNGDPIGDCRLCIVDTESQTWQYADT